MCEILEFTSENEFESEYLKLWTEKKWIFSSRFYFFFDFKMGHTR